MMFYDYLYISLCKFLTIYFVSLKKKNSIGKMLFILIAYIYSMQKNHESDVTIILFLLLFISNNEHHHEKSSSILIWELFLSLFFFISLTLWFSHTHGKCICFHFGLIFNSTSTALFFCCFFFFVLIPLLLWFIRIYLLFVFQCFVLNNRINT